jgi:CDP-glucose 4,6-dehydratase
MMPSPLRFSELEHQFRGRRCLVTGHTGFKGAWLCLMLTRFGARVAGYALDPRTPDDLFVQSRLGSAVEDHRGDIRDAGRLAGVVSEFRPEFVWHLAAQPLVRAAYADPRSTYEVNVQGTVNLLDALRTLSGVRAVAVITTDKVYDPLLSSPPFTEDAPLGGHDPYSSSKAAAEIATDSYARAFFAPAGVPVVRLRSGNVIGGGDWAPDRLVPDLVRAVRDKRPVELRHPRSVRPWQHVLEPLHGYLLAIVAAGRSADGAPLLSRAWNFGPHERQLRSVAEVADLFHRDIGDGAWRQAPVAPAEGTWKETEILALDSSRAARELGWVSRWDFSRSVAATAAWYRDYLAGKDAEALSIRDIEAYGDLHG